VFFFLSKTISFLVKPASIVIFTLLASFLIRNKIWRRRLMFLGFGLLIIFTNEFLANTVIGWWEKPPRSLQSIEHHEVAVVLGGMASLSQEPRDRVYFNQSVDRILHTIRLYHLGKIDRIIVTGGSGSIYDQTIKEATILRDFLLQNDIEESDLILESESRNTRENAVNTVSILGKDYPNKVLLVTSASHMRRAKGCFDEVGLESTEFPTSFRKGKFRPDMIYTPSATALLKWEIVFREMTGYAVYTLLGYI